MWGQILMWGQSARFSDFRAFGQNGFQAKAGQESATYVPRTQCLSIRIVRAVLHRRFAGNGAIAWACVNRSLPRVTPAQTSKMPHLQRARKAPPWATLRSPMQVGTPLPTTCGVDGSPHVNTASRLYNTPLGCHAYVPTHTDPLSKHIKYTKHPPET